MLLGPKRRLRLVENSTQFSFSQPIFQNANMNLWTYQNVLLYTFLPHSLLFNATETFEAEKFRPSRWTQTNKQYLN